MPAKKFTQEEAITPLNNIFNYYYNYTQSIYNGANKPFEYICPIHGLITTQLYRKHKTNGCPKCGNARSGSHDKHDDKSIIKAATLKHNNYYDYTGMEVYQVNKKTMITYKCVYHGIQEQRLDAHLNGHGCRSCNCVGHTKEYYRNKQTLLYYVKINNLYKIGVTIHDIHIRFNNSDNVILIESWIFEDGAEAFIIEQNIIKNNVKNKYFGENVIKSGNTELFITDIKQSVLEEVNLS